MQMSYRASLVQTCLCRLLSYLSRT
ncbi:hypothetical protein D047_3842A, partial [Vibrio parahaemolyticus VPTS-2010_2]